MKEALSVGPGSTPPLQLLVSKKDLEAKELQNHEGGAALREDIQAHDSSGLWAGVCPVTRLSVLKPVTPQAEQQDITSKNTEHNIMFNLIITSNFFSVSVLHAILGYTCIF